MTPEQFNDLSAQGYNRIPVQQTLMADLETPVSTYLKLANQPYSYLFESVVGGETWGRYSIIGLACQKTIQVRGHDIYYYQGQQLIEHCQHEDPLAWIEAYQQNFRVAALPDLPSYYGGLVGYFGYDTVRYIEPKLGPCQKPNELDNPDIFLMVSEEVVVFDNLRNQMHLIVLADPNEDHALENAKQRLQQLSHTLENTTLPHDTYQGNGQTHTSAALTSNIEFDDYSKAVEQAREYMLNGDVMQVVFARRLSGEFSAPPMHLYRALRHLNPSPYLYYMHFDDMHVVGSSPEVLARLEDNEITLRPIAGTRPRGKTVTEDLALEQDLLSDPKELAEHLMLIDLGRNDVSRVSKIGSVTLTEKMIIERYSQVMHIVSNVTGKIKDNMSAIDVLRAVFPAGTLTGAPKVRAMEIIDELETVKRDVYAGAVGYLAWNGNMDTAIAIRTAVIKNEKISIQVGGGLVVDSTPEGEWSETVNKSKAVCKAMTLAERGFNHVIND